MSGFIVRIELLHSPFTPTGEDYTQLHARMHAAGFSTSVLSRDGFWYSLPPAEYYGEGAMTAAEARQVVMDVVSSGLRFGIHFRVIVVDANAWEAYNLAVA